MKKELLNWLKAQKDTLDNILSLSALNFVDDFTGKSKHMHGIFKFDHSVCENESLNLANGTDLSYDRPSIGLTYNCWYLPRRINTSLNLIIDGFIKYVEENRNLYIFDIGAGTGSISIAFQLCLYGLRKLGFRIPQCHIINVDISPFMLAYHKEQLMPLMMKHYPLPDLFTNTYAVNSWVSEEQFEIFNPWLIASYLFDHSEHHEQIKKVFLQYIENYNPSMVSLITSMQYNKRILLDRASSQILDLNYSSSTPPDYKIFNGIVNKLSSIRQNLNTVVETSFSNNSPRWDEHFGFYAKNHHRQQTSIDFRASTRFNPFTDQIKVRREIKLNKEQVKAAEFTGRPKVVRGPAGSGKSVVLTEYIKNVIERIQYDPNVKILVTTFNKKLIGFLKEWVLSLLDNNRADVIGDHIRFRGSSHTNIFFWHFDVLPTRLGQAYDMADNPIPINHRILSEENQLRWLEHLAGEYFENGYSHLNPRYKNPNFLKDEYERVVYGQQYKTLEAYKAGVRIRRQFPNIPKNGSEREFIFKVIDRYLFSLEHFNGGHDTFYSRRNKLLEFLNSQQFEPVFDYIIVDEFQDCTQADFQIFYNLIKSTNQIILGGDLAQSINLGSTAIIPRADQNHDGARMRNIDHVTLSGSYRLPFMVSKFVKPLSQKINSTQNENADIIEAYKGAPPGARPIIVYAESSQAMKQKLAWIMNTYKYYDIPKFTILEKDDELIDELNSVRNNIAETDTILKLKGMEKQLIVYSTRSKINSEEDLNYFLYTIFTRTCSLLIIAMFPNLSVYQKGMINFLCNENRDSIIIWDTSTEDMLNSLNEIG